MHRAGRGGWSVTSATTRACRALQAHGLTALCCGPVPQQVLAGRYPPAQVWTGLGGGGGGGVPVPALRVARREGGRDGRMPSGGGAEIGRGRIRSRHQVSLMLREATH